MIKEESFKKRFDELSELDELRFMADFHKTVENQRQKDLHD